MDSVAESNEQRALELISKVVQRPESSPPCGVPRDLARADHDDWSRSGAVLVVEPASAWADTLCASFRDAGLSALHAPDGATALGHLEQDCPKLVCSEALVHDEHWTSLLQAVRGAGEATQFVLLTDRLSPELAFDAMNLGCDLILTKPALAADVVQALGGSHDADTLSLEGAKALYLAGTVASHASLAEAARVLAVERRSLRRMLQRLHQKKFLPCNAGDVKTFRCDDVLDRASPPVGVKPATSNNSVLIVDPDTRDRDRLAVSFGQDWSVIACSDAAAASAALREQRPMLVVTELQIGSGTAFELAKSTAGECETAFVLLSGCLSVAAAVRAHRLGFAGVLAKPANAADLMTRLQASPRTSVACSGMSLERALWEHIWRGVLTEPTRNRAARKLGLQSRSLRRMLARHGPAR